MGAKAYQTSGLYSLNARAIQEYLNDFLCSDSVDSYSNSILTRADFQPDSFTVLERLSSPNFLSPWERDARESLKSQVAAEIQMLQAERAIVAADVEALVDFVVDQFRKLLEYQVNDGPIAAQIFNQEFPDVSRRVNYPPASWGAS